MDLRKKPSEIYSLEEEGFQLKHQFNPEKIEKMAEHYREILKLIGEDPNREGLIDTPAMQFLTKGYHEDPKEILLSAKFKEDYQQMVS